MRKKLFLFTVLIWTSITFAAWDYQPILEAGKKQAAIALQHSSQDPLSALDIAAGFRISPLSWLELYALVPYRLYTDYDGQSEKYNEKVSDMKGVGNIAFGTRFQFSQSVSAYVDGYLPGNSKYAYDYFMVDAGVQHSSIWTHVIWSTDLSFFFGDVYENEYLKLGNEILFIIGPVTPYVRFDVINGFEADGPGYNNEVGGNNGFMFGFGLKVTPVELLTIDLFYGFYEGDRYSVEGLEDPSLFNVTIFLNF